MSWQETIEKKTAKSDLIYSNPYLIWSLENFIETKPINTIYLYKEFAYNNTYISNSIIIRIIFLDKYLN